MAQTFTPAPELLTNYARILVEFALGDTKGIKKGDIVYVQFDADALPLAIEVYRIIIEQGGHPIIRMSDEVFSKILLIEGSEAQIEFFPEKYLKTLIDTIDHRMFIMAPRDPFYLKDADPAKVMLAGKKNGKIRKWILHKQDQGKLTWTLCLYGTEGLAREAGLSLEEYWEQIERACYLGESEPVKTWRRLDSELGEIRDTLTDMPINTLNVKAKDTDITFTMGEKRKWLSGGGNNIPSFEVFTSPDWRGTEGHIYFDYPLYRFGNIIKDIRLEFKDGKVVKASAAKNEKLLKELIKQENADKVGEYSLTDTKYSKISKFMANTLYDENYGGEWGNTHMAVGTAFHEAYSGDKEGMKEEDWAKLGYNESPEHTDIMATTDRVVEATMKDGSKKVIYKGGHFTL